MDFWIIGSKAGLLSYVISATFFLTPTTNPWYILASLLYLCLNISIPIFKRIRPKLILVVASSTFIISCAVWINPHYILLLPIGLFELVGLSGINPLLALIGFLATIPFIPSPLLSTYLLTAFLTLLVIANVRLLTQKVSRLEADKEKMREDVQKLTRSLNENKEYMRQSEYTIKLEERNRLSQQIHDDIGHAMAGALIQMEASKRLLASEPTKASELLHNAIQISKDGLERIRLTLKDVKPKSEELGINRLRLMVDELSASQTVNATLGHEGDVDAITPIQWKIIQENALESITNSLKYGKASGIHIQIAVLNKFVKAVVSDNGIGAVQVVKGLGIVGMEERAASAGGTVIVDGTRGFSVTTLLPTSGR